MAKRHTEHDIQASCVTYFKMRFPTCECIAIPNEATHMRSYYFQAAGLRLGAADLLLLFPTKEYKIPVVFVEFKTKYNKQSIEQVDFQESVTGLGYQYYVVHSLDEFIKMLDNLKTFY